VSIPKLRQDVEAAKKHARVSARTEWIATEYWDTGRLRARGNKIPHPIAPVFVAYDPVTGIAVEVQPVGVQVASPRADYEREAKRALAEAIAARKDAADKRRIEIEEKAAEARRHEETMHNVLVGNPVAEDAFLDALQAEFGPGAVEVYRKKKSNPPVEADTTPHEGKPKETSHE
jgi:hypothetical protein